MASSNRNWGLRTTTAVSRLVCRHKQSSTGVTERTGGEGTSGSGIMGLGALTVAMQALEPMTALKNTKGLRTWSVLGSVAASRQPEMDR